MGKSIVTRTGEGMMEDARQWESKVFEQVCVAGQREATEYLGQLDENLFSQRPAGWRVVGFRERTLITRFGEVHLWRRLYRDKSGRYHFLLDEYLGLNAYQAATVEIQAMSTILCGEMSFRKAADFLEQWMAGLLSHSTCWRLLQRTGDAAARANMEEVEAVFGRGEPIVQAGERRVERLYMEADGVYVRLQRQSRKHLELCSAIAYEGRERASGTREAYRLCEKQVYCHVGDPVSFWEGVSLAWAHKWDLRRVREVILGGDGAAWIRAGADTFAGASWQLDGFHLARACRQAFGSQAGRDLYQKLRTGDTALTPASLSQIPVREGKQAERASQWVEKVVQEKWGLDWRVRQNLTLEDASGLGCMEGAQAHLLAARMKGKGRSWSPQGASHMAKVQELLTRGEVQRWCSRQKRTETSKTRYTRHLRSPDQWLQAAVPAFYGPSPNAPWVQYLRQLVHPHHLLN